MRGYALGRGGEGAHKQKAGMQSGSKGSRQGGGGKTFQEENANSSWGTEFCTLKRSLGREAKYLCWGSGEILGGKRE